MIRAGQDTVLAEHALASPTITIFDLEFTAWECSMARHWLTPGEFKEVVQIGAREAGRRKLRSCWTNSTAGAPAHQFARCRPISKISPASPTSRSRRAGHGFRRRL